jgi:hypothetical protein
MACTMPADVRIFSGAAMGASVAGGWPACWVHVGEAESKALAPLRGAVVGDWRVTCRRVDIDEEGWPKLGPVLWEARRPP